MKENEIIELLEIIENCMKQAYDLGYLLGERESTHDAMYLTREQFKEHSKGSYKVISYNIIISAIKTYFVKKTENEDVTKKIIAKYVKEKLFPEHGSI